MRDYNGTMAATHITRTSAGVHLGASRARGSSPVIDLDTIVLGTVLSFVAALLTVVLATFGEVSSWSLVASVVAVGFVTSWVRSGRSHRRRPAIVTIHH